MLNYPASDIHVITALVPDAEQDVAALVERLHAALAAAAAGQRVYTGRVLTSAGHSTQVGPGAPVCAISNQRHAVSWRSHGALGWSHAT